MKILEFFSMALKNFKKKKLRTGINIFAISIGVMLIITLVSLGSGVQSFFQNKIKELYNLKQVNILPIEYQSTSSVDEKLNKVNSNGEVDYSMVFAPKKISEKLLEELRTDKRIEDILIKYEDTLSEIDIDGKKIKDITIAYYNGNKYLSNEEDSIKEINSKERIQIPVNYIAYGQDILSEDTKSILVTEDVIRLSFGFNDVEEAIGKEVTLTTMVADYDLSKNHTIKAKIVGLIDQRFFQPSIVVSKDIMEEVKNFYLNNETPLLDRGADSVQIAVKDVNNVSLIVENIEQNHGYLTESVQTVAKTINSALIWFKISLSLVGLIVICIATLDVVNTMIMSVFERTKSIGLMKATGASNKDILKLFLVEGGTIGLLGGILGLVFSIINMSLIRGFIITLSTAVTGNNEIVQVIKIDIKIAIFTILFAIVLTIIASLYPSLKASKLDPIDSLKHD